MPPWLWGRAEGVRTFVRTGAEALAALLVGAVGVANVLIISVLAGCASYTPLRLPTRPNLAARASALTVPVTAFATPGVHLTRVDLARPLDAADLAALAVLVVVFLPQLSPSTSLPGSKGSLMVICGGIAAVIMVLATIGVLGSLAGFC